MAICNHFDRTYVINLKSRPDRRQEIEAELNRVDMPITPGRVEYFLTEKPTDAAGFPNPGARGCFLSHLSIMRQARELGLRNVLVIEDDLAISPKLAEDEDAIVEQLHQTPNWGLCYFGYVIPDQDPFSATLVNGTGAKEYATRLVPYVGELRTTHFYAVNGPAIDRVVRCFEAIEKRPPGHPDGGPMQIDGAYNTFRHQNPDVLTLLASPCLGFQRSSRSDITPGWKDRMPVLRTFVSFARQARRKVGV
jgi:hypothetical protein